MESEHQTEEMESEYQTEEMESEYDTEEMESESDTEEMEPEYDAKGIRELGQSLRELENRHRADEKKNVVATAAGKSSALSLVTVAERLGDRSGVNPADRSFVSVSVKCSLMPHDVDQLGGPEMAQRAIQEFTDAWTKKYQAEVFDFIKTRKQTISKIPDDLIGSLEDKLASFEGGYTPQQQQ
ncbi:hypothetical protein EG329_008324 [Mollisiaceae sp. DMI_Dod_QoI]|nr:hypothetical protein EG329_008324 [Helotiales sp. DMI_Dod_QoI]